jgi:hypothetical protein
MSRQERQLHLKCHAGHRVIRILWKRACFEHSCLTTNEIILLTYFWALEYPQQFEWYKLPVNQDTLDWFSFCGEMCLDILEKDTIRQPGYVTEVD